MTLDVRAAAKAVIEEEREAYEARNGVKPGKRYLLKRLALRLAEIGVNTFFPTNGSGNNMSRG